MKLIPKHQNGSELIKRKQAFLKANGVNVKVDGKWGKWQQEQYNKLTEKDKHYNTTPLGFLSYLYDKTLGEGTTYHEDPQLVTGYTGEIKSDDRSAAKRWLSQQMNDNSTPLGYITQTVAPAAATAGAIVYGGVPLLNATGHGIKAAVTNPQAALQTVKALPKVIKQAAPSVTKTFAKETAKGLAGASAVNVGSKLTTGKTWGQHVGELTGLSEGAAEFTNPGWFVSPIYSGATRLFPKSITVYKGGAKPFTRDYTFFTTDKEYAKQFGPIQKYKLKYKHPAYTEDPLIYKNMEWIHFNIDNNLRQQNKPYSDIIIGHDALTNEGLMPSRGTEYVVWNPKQIKVGSKKRVIKQVSNIVQDLTKYNKIRKISKELNQQIKNFDGTVSENYFNSPYNWYRITESPEVYGIKEMGKNVTTRDAVDMYIPSNQFRLDVIENKLTSKDGYWYKPLKRTFNFSKRGSAHGNTSQAAKGHLWQGTLANSNRFPITVLEGDMPVQTYRGFNPTTGVDSRTDFHLVDSETIPTGARIGFHTGEMPIEGLRSFTRLNNGRYRYDGLVIPYKTTQVNK